MLHQIGRALIVIGLLMFGLVAYQLWGTGIEYARQQSELKDQFEELLAAATDGAGETVTAEPPAPTSAPPSEPSPAPATTEAVATTEPATTTTAPAPTLPATTSSSTAPAGDSPVLAEAANPNAAIAEGRPLGLIEIPAIGLDQTAIVQGVSLEDLKSGPGHYMTTPVPGQLGNAAIAGHRTTYGQPFFDLDELEAGDEIVVTTMGGVWTYRVTATEIVGPSDTHVIATTDRTVATLTLTTCHPKWSARERLIVYAELDTAASPEPEPYVDPLAPPTTAAPVTTAPATTVPAPTVEATTASTDPATTVAAPTSTVAARTATVTSTTTARPVVDAAAQDAFSHGWFSDPAAWPHVIAWGLVLIAIWTAGWLLARRTRRTWVGVAAGIVPFVVVLYFWYENVNRLLPAAL